MKYNEVLDRLQKLINREVSQSELIEATGTAQSTMSNRCIRNSEIPADDIQKINIYFGVNIFENSITNVISSDYIEKVTLDYYPDLDFSCGNGLMPFSEAKEQMTIPVSLIKGYRKERKYIIVNAKSDSMVPEIKPNDLLIIRMIDTEPIIDNHIYIFCYDERLYCKYLSWNIHQIIVRSANPDYKTQLIEKENINLFQLYGEVVGHFRYYGG